MSDIQLSIWMGEDMRRALEVLARRRGVSMAAVIKTCLAVELTTELGAWWLIHEPEGGELS